LLTSVFDPDNAFIFETPPYRKVFATLSDMPEEMYPYQQAVMFLFEQHWRVRVCERCNSPFVASHNQAKYCGVTQNEEGDTCASLSRAESQKQDSVKHREERNERRRKKYVQEKRPLTRNKVGKQEKR
jgi:hypothetical protein